jgi:hypothetical protein
VRDVEEQLRRFGEALEDHLLRYEETPTAAPRGRHRRARRLVLAGVAACVGVAVAVPFVAARDDHQRHVVTAPAPAPHSVFDAKTGMVLLLSDGGEGLVAIDLDRRLAARHAIDGERAGDQPTRLTLTGGSVVVGWGGIYAEPLVGGPSRKIDDGTIYLAAAEPGTIWTLTWPGGGLGVGPSTVRRVRVDGTVELSVPFDTGLATALLGVPGGLVVSTPAGIAVWDAATNRIGPLLGAGREFSAVASDGRMLVWCKATCADVATAPLARSGSATAPHTPGAQALALSSDGRWMAVLRPGANGDELVVTDRQTGKDDVAAIGLKQYGSISWAPDNRQLFYVTNSYQNTTMDVGRYDITARSWKKRTIPVGDGIGGYAVAANDAKRFFMTPVGLPTACEGSNGGFPSGRSSDCDFGF